mgnify:CR=1 FL=1
MNGKVVTILRGYSYEQIRTVCLALCKSKTVRNVEITLNTDNAYEIIEKIIQEFGDVLEIGAGTVKTFDELKKVLEYGVKFVLAPNGYSKEMIDYAHNHKALAIPSAFTPTEIFTQFTYGADIIKVFPANELSTSYAKKAKEPLGNIPLMAVGGVNKGNVAKHFEGGYDYIGTCHGLFREEDIVNQNLDGLVNTVLEFEKEI